jgi:hypothetical protein
LLHSIRFDARQTSATPDDIRPILLRALSHFLVDQVPDPGLPDLCNSLREFWEFYSLPPSRTLMLPTKRQVTARIGERYERPEFHVDEE